MKSRHMLDPSQVKLTQEPKDLVVDIIIVRLGKAAVILA